jgi:hypothetical protein
MFSRFLASRFSGYIAIISVIAILGLVYYIYNEGKTACENEVITKYVKADEESKKGSNNVRKEEQSFDSTELDRGLCDLGIVRGNTGCQ